VPVGLTLIRQRYRRVHGDRGGQLGGVLCAPLARSILHWKQPPAIAKQRARRGASGRLDDPAFRLHGQNQRRPADGAASCSGWLRVQGAPHSAGAFGKDCCHDLKVSWPMAVNVGSCRTKKGGCLCCVMWGTRGESSLAQARRRHCQNSAKRAPGFPRASFRSGL
jgi:hypothetical protein